MVNFIWAFGSSIMYIHLPIFTIQNGHSPEGAAIMLSCIGGLSFFSRGTSYVPLTNVYRVVCLRLYLLTPGQFVGVDPNSFNIQLVVDENCSQAMLQC